MSRKLLALIMCLALMVFAVPGLGEETAEHTDTVILFTNDVHCAIETGIGYSGVMAYKNAFEASGCETLLVDSGDAIQGGPMGAFSKGEYIIDIMNHMGYSVSAVGNHEFDYGMEQFKKLKDMAEFDYVACNFIGEDGTPVCDAYTIVERGGWKIAFVGVTTPYTLTSSAPAYFQNDAGEFIYSFLGGDDASALYTCVQSTVDAARADGADFVILLSHLGVTYDEGITFTSSNLINNTTGIDAVLDGHSHTVLDGETVKNADGEEIILASTGTKLANLGELRISADGTLSEKLHSETIFRDADTDAYIAEINDEFTASLSDVVGTTAFDLCIEDPETGARIVRTAETNLGDLSADAIRAYTGADVAMCNGGGMRDKIPAGDITKMSILTVNPFGNAICVAEVTGQTIMDALEMGVMKLPEEFGGFMQVSGITYEIDMSVPSPVTLDENGLFASVDGERRVKNVTVNGAPIDPEATYTLAGLNYHLKNNGDGMAMFNGCTIVMDDIVLDSEALAAYISGDLGGVIPEEYSNPYGQGRIVAID